MAAMALRRGFFPSRRSRFLQTGFALPFGFRYRATLDYRWPDSRSVADLVTPAPVEETGLARFSHGISQRGGADGRGCKAHLALHSQRDWGTGGVHDSTSRSPMERNTVDMPGCAAAVESP